MTTSQIPVKGMHCGGCARRLSTALAQLEGVREAKADHEAETVTVTYDPERVSEHRLRERIEVAGYEAAA